MSYSSNGNRPKLSEKGLLTPDNCVVALIDHQPQMLFGTSNFDRQAIINNTVALGKASRVFDVPVVLTTVETNSFSGHLKDRAQEDRACWAVDRDLRGPSHGTGDPRRLRNLRGGRLLRRREST